MSDEKGRNSKLQNQKANTITKPTSQVGSMGKVEGEESDEQRSGPRHHVRIKSRRVRLLDIDNLYGGSKHLIDSLRLSGVIPDDDPASITLQVTEEKIKGYKNEETEVEVKCV
jgi:hypothetical protein